MGGRAPRARMPPPRRGQRLERGHKDLRERRERLDRVAQHVERDVSADGERGLLRPVRPRLGSDGVRTGEERYPSLSRVRKPGDSAYSCGCMSPVLATSDSGVVALNRASVAPTDAVCGSV